MSALKRKLLVRKNKFHVDPEMEFSLFTAVAHLEKIDKQELVNRTFQYIQSNEDYIKVLSPALLLVI